MMNEVIDSLRVKVRELIEKHQKRKLLINLNKYLRYSIDISTERNTQIYTIPHVHYFKNYDSVQFYLDSNCSLFLCDDGVPIAVIGFNYETYDFEGTKILCFVIQQIQGAKFITKSGMSDNNNFYLEAFYWQKVLVELCHYYCLDILNLKYRADAVISFITPADYNDWSRATKKNYDGVARDMKYKLLTSKNIQKDNFYEVLDFLENKYSGYYYKTLYPIIKPIKRTAVNTLTPSHGIKELAKRVLSDPDFKLASYSVGSTILDIGAGYGRDSLHLLKNYPLDFNCAILVDSDKEALEGAKRNFEDAGFIEGKQFILKASKLSIFIRNFRRKKDQMPFIQGIDFSNIRVIILSHIIPYLTKKYLRYLLSMYAVTMQKGTFFYINFFTKNDVKNLAKHGDKIKSIYSVEEMKKLIESYAFDIVGEGSSDSIFSNNKSSKNSRHYIIFKKGDRVYSQEVSKRLNKE